MNRKRDRIEEPDLLPEPEREAAESPASKCDPHSIVLTESVKFSILA